MAENPFINALPNGAEGKQRDGKEPPELLCQGFRIVVFLLEEVTIISYLVVLFLEI